MITKIRILISPQNCNSGNFTVYHRLDAMVVVQISEVRLVGSVLASDWLSL